MSKARTTREEIDHTVEAYKSGMSLTEIAENTGKVKQTICNILDKEGVRAIQRRTTVEKGVRC
jgi:hypothetical protein